APPHPRRPRGPLGGASASPGAGGAGPAPDAAAGLRGGEMGGGAAGRGRAVRVLPRGARLEDGGSWARTLTLREATADADRLAAAAIACLAEVQGPVETLIIRADASGRVAGRQLAFAEAGAGERARRARPTRRPVRPAPGDGAGLRLGGLRPRAPPPRRPV